MNHSRPFQWLIFGLLVVVTVACGGRAPDNSANVQNNDPPPVYYSVNDPNKSCEGAPPPQFLIEDRGLITTGNLNLRSQPIANDNSNIVAILPDGSKVTIINGVACSHGGYWWEVESDNGERGWMRERSQNGDSYLLPLEELSSD